MFFLGLDIGTTRMKCGIYNEAGNLVYSDLCDYGTVARSRETYIDVDTIFNRVVEMLKKAYASQPFDSIAISSLGESFVLLDSGDRLLFSPMLYTDPRGEAQADELSAHSQLIFSIAGVVPQGMYSAYKLLWIKQNLPDVYNKASKLMLVGEYIGYLLTGVRAIDYSLAARTGIFDVHKCQFSPELCELFGIDRALFSPAVRSGSIIATLKDDITSAINATSPVTLIAGGHDQVCAAIGAGAVEAGVCADGMGTVECLTAVYRSPMTDIDMGMCGYPNVPHGAEGLYCTYLLNYSCGSLVRWWMDSAYGGRGLGESELFAEAERDFTDSPTGLLVLPYFAGASTPYQNINAKGAILNLGLSDSPSRVYQGILEGLCMEMRLNLELTCKHGIQPTRIIATGGGSHSRRWLQIKADVMGLPVYPLKVKEAGICGGAVLSAATLLGEDIGSVARRFVTLDTPIEPRADIKKQYDSEFAKYRELYTAIKKFY